MKKVISMSLEQKVNQIFQPAVYNDNEYAGIKMSVPGDYSEASASDIKLSEDMIISNATDEKTKLFETVRALLGL